MKVPPGLTVSEVRSFEPDESIVHGVISVAGHPRISPPELLIERPAPHVCAGRVLHRIHRRRLQKLPVATEDVLGDAMLTPDLILASDYGRVALEVRVRSSGVDLWPPLAILHARLAHHPVEHHEVGHLQVSCRQAVCIHFRQELGKLLVELRAELHPFIRDLDKVVPRRDIRRAHCVVSNRAFAILLVGLVEVRDTRRRLVATHIGPVELDPLGTEAIVLRRRRAVYYPLWGLRSVPVGHVGADEVLLGVHVRGERLHKDHVWI
eukprot:scaffold1070_cov245-Pinguiococcus_pyrenoidosus.AAC.35